MKELRTDAGTEFKNELFKELSKLMGTEHKTSTPHHHQSVGTIERNHRNLNEYFRAYVEDLRDWDTYLPYFNYCYNTTSHDAFDNKYSPYELVYGRLVNKFENINLNRIEPIYNIDNYALEVKYRLQTAQKEVRALIDKMKIRNKNYYDKRTNVLNVKIGDMILLKNEPYNKYKAPFEVIEIKDKNIVINKNGKIYETHKNRVVKP